MISKLENKANLVSPVSPFVLIKGAGEMASAIAWRLFRANIRHICMLDLANPLCVRREVSFCTALQEGESIVEQVSATAVRTTLEMNTAWKRQKIAVMFRPDWDRSKAPKPDIIIDAILAKRNLGTAISQAALVVALGPGFESGKDCHLVIETNRGHDLGRIIEAGSAAPNTGIPGTIVGESANRILRAPGNGVFRAETEIGNPHRKGDIVGFVDHQPVTAKLDGMVRGLIRSGTPVTVNLKLGDIDPRGEKSSCYSISDKARAISGSVLESVMRHFNREKF